MTPTTGAYRQLFLDALDALGDTPTADHELIAHYRELLKNPAYKFGIPQSANSRSYASGELFLTS